MKNSILRVLLVLGLLLNTGCQTGSEEEQQNEGFQEMSNSLFPLLLMAGVSMASSRQKNEKTSCQETETSRFTGKVVDSLSNFPLAVVEITTFPTSTTVTTGNDGSYTIQKNICQNWEYSILFNKHGYTEKVIKQTASPGEYNTGTVTLTRDTDTYSFINILVRGTDNSPLSGALIGYAGGGTTVSTSSTNSTGIYSVPILKTSSSRVLTISAENYKTASTLYNVNSGSCSSSANGTFSCTQDSIVVELQQ